MKILRYLFQKPGLEVLGRRLGHGIVRYNKAAAASHPLSAVVPKLH